MLRIQSMWPFADAFNDSGRQNCSVFEPCFKSKHVEISSERLRIARAPCVVVVVLLLLFWFACDILVYCKTKTPWSKIKMEEAFSSHQLIGE